MAFYRMLKVTGPGLSEVSDNTGFTVEVVDIETNTYLNVHLDVPNAELGNLTAITDEMIHQHAELTPNDWT